MRTLACVFVAAAIACTAQAGDVLRPRIAVLDMGLPTGARGEFGCPSDPDVFVRRLSASYDVRRVRGTGLAAALNRSSCDLLVIPSGSAFPADAEKQLKAFLAAGGSFLSCGGYAFDRAVVWRNGRWETVGVCDEPVPAPDVPVSFPAPSVWSSAGDGLKMSACVGPDGAPGVSLASAELKSRAVATADVEFPAGLSPSVVSVRAKDDGGTPRCWFELQEADGSCWHALLPLTRDWKEFLFLPGDFAGLPQNATLGRGGKGDRIDFAKVIRIGFGFDTEIFYPGRPYFASVASLRFGEDPCRDARNAIRPRINTRTAYIRDAIRPTPEQIGVFDPSFPLDPTVRTETSAAADGLLPKVALSGPMTGLSALGPLGVNGNGFDPNRCVWRPVLDCFGSSGKASGQAGALLLHHEGTYAGSSWAIFGVENRDLFATGLETVEKLLPAVVRHLLRHVHLNGTTADVSCWRRGEMRSVKTRVRNDTGKPVAGTVTFSLRDRDGRQVFATTVPCIAATATNTEVTASYAVPEEASDYLTLTAELRSSSGELLDREEGAVVIWTPSVVANGPRLGKEDHRLTIDGDVRFFMGCNTFWGQHKSVTARSPMQFERDFAQMRRMGLRWTRLFLRLEDESTSRDADAYVQLAAQHGLVLYLTPNLWNTHKPDELARETAKMAEIATRYRLAPHLAIDICNEPVMTGCTNHQAAARAEYVWAESCRAAARAVNPNLLVSVGWNGGWGGAAASKDPAFASLPLDFTDRHYYGIPERLMIEAKDIDQRALGKPFVIGECGAKCHPTFVREDPWRMGDDDASYSRRFRCLVSHAFGCGASALLSWHWRDPMEGIFPCGLVHATGVARPTAAVFSRMATTFGKLRLADDPPDTVVVLDEAGRFDPLTRGRVTNAVRALTESLVWLGVNFSVVTSSQTNALPTTVRCVLDPARFSAFNETVLRRELATELRAKGAFVARQPGDADGLETFRVRGRGATGWVFWNGTQRPQDVVRGAAKLTVAPDRAGYVQLSEDGRVEVCEEL